MIKLSSKPRITTYYEMELKIDFFVSDTCQGHFENIHDTKQKFFKVERAKVTKSHNVVHSYANNYVLL